MKVLYLIAVIMTFSATTLQLPLAVQATEAPDTESSDTEAPWHGGQIELTSSRDNGEKCLKLSDHVAAYCNYTHTLLPNTRGHTTIEDAEKEFNDFFSLINSQCSPYLGTLLCFHYFPLSSCKPEDEVSGSDGATNPSNKDHSILPSLQIYPCKELCEIAKNTECTNHVRSGPPYKWAEHLNCSLPEYISSQSEGHLCAYGDNTRLYRKPTIIPTVATNSTPSVVSTKISTTESTTTESLIPVKTDAPEATKPKCPTKRCGVRTAASGSAIKKNPYTFILKGTFIEKFEEFGLHAYRVSVMNTYYQCNLGIGESAVIYTNEGHCRENFGLDSFVGNNQVFLIAGSHTATASGFRLSLDCTNEPNKKPIVSPWTKRYKLRMDGWISNRQQCP